MARKKSSKVDVTTDNDLGKFLTGNTEVTSQVKRKVKTKVKPEVKAHIKGEVIGEVEFTKQLLTEYGFELEVLPSGQKTNLSHKQPYIINGFSPMFFKGFYTFTIHHPPDKIYQYIKTIEFV